MGSGFAVEVLLVGAVGETAHVLLCRAAFAEIVCALCRTIFFRVAANPRIKCRRGAKHHNCKALSSHALGETYASALLASGKLFRAEQGQIQIRKLAQNVYSTSDECSRKGTGITQTRAQAEDQDQWDLSRSDDSVPGTFGDVFFLRVTFEIAVQAGAPDPQDLSSTQAITLAHLQHTLNVRFAHLFHG